jgi:hypothetical protein
METRRSVMITGEVRCWNNKTQAEIIAATLLFVD